MLRRADRGEGALQEQQAAWSTETFEAQLQPQESVRIATASPAATFSAPCAEALACRLRVEEELVIDN